jgi:hypothetical protein
MMKIKDLKKGDWIINTKIEGSKPWYVCNANYNGMVLIRRDPKIGRLTTLLPGQLRAFLKIMV